MKRSGKANAVVMAAVLTIGLILLDIKIYTSTGRSRLAEVSSAITSVIRLHNIRAKKPAKNVSDSEKIADLHNKVTDLIKKMDEHEKTYHSNENYAGRTLAFTNTQKREGMNASDTQLGPSQGLLYGSSDFTASAQEMKSPKILAPGILQTTASEMELYTPSRNPVYHPPNRVSRFNSRAVDVSNEINKAMNKLVGEKLTDIIKSQEGIEEVLDKRQFNPLQVKDGDSDRQPLKIDPIVEVRRFDDYNAFREYGMKKRQNRSEEINDSDAKEIKLVRMSQLPALIKANRNSSEVDAQIDMQNMLDSHGMNRHVAYSNRPDLDKPLKTEEFSIPSLKMPKSISEVKIMKAIKINSPTTSKGFNEIAKSILEENRTRKVIDAIERLRSFERKQAVKITSNQENLIRSTKNFVRKLDKAVKKMEKAAKKLEESSYIKTGSDNMIRDIGKEKIETTEASKNSHLSLKDMKTDTDGMRDTRSKNDLVPTKEPINLEAVGKASSELVKKPAATNDSLAAEIEASAFTDDLFKSIDFSKPLEQSTTNGVDKLDNEIKTMKASKKLLREIEAAGLKDIVQINEDKMEGSRVPSEETVKS